MVMRSFIVFSSDDVHLGLRRCRQIGGGLLSTEPGRNLLFDGRGGGSLFDKLGCFLRVRHVGHMAGIHFDRLGISALRHHALLVRVDRPVCGGHMYQLGLVFQAGVVTLWVNESVEIGTCDLAMKLDTAEGTSAAKSAAKCSCSIHQLPLLSGLNALDDCGRACSIEAQLSPSSSANAAI